MRINRAGTLVTAENLSLSVPAMSHKIALVIVIDNGDSPPLAVAAEPQGFRAAGLHRAAGKHSAPPLLGRRKAIPPDYDYALFFTAKPLPRRHNWARGPQRAIRRSCRRSSWSDRHPVILWLAMLIAVAALALAGFRHEKTRQDFRFWDIDCDKTVLISAHPERVVPVVCTSLEFFW